MSVPAPVRDLVSTGKDVLARVPGLPWRRIAAISSGAGVAVVLLIGLLVRIEALAEELDGEWMEEILEMRGPFWEAVSRGFDFLGGGWFAILALPLAIAAAFLVARRPWAALVFVLGSAVSAGIVQALKVLFGRARPEDILLELESGSFPSGHTANAATVAVLLAVLLMRWWVAVAGAVYVVLMALSRTYLGAHWITDTIGGALLGAAVALGAWAVFAPRLARERERRAARGSRATVSS